MEQILTRRFTIEEVAYALKMAFPSEFFNGNSAAVATDMRLFDFDENGIEAKNDICLMKDQKFSSKRRLEVSWSQNNGIRRA